MFVDEHRNNVSGCSVSVDDYENSRGPALKKENFKIPSHVRVSILLEQVNVSLKEVKDAELNAHRNREKLRRSMRKPKIPGSQQIEEIIEMTMRRIVQLPRCKARGQEKKKDQRNRIF